MALYTHVLRSSFAELRGPQVKPTAFINTIKHLEPRSRSSINSLHQRLADREVYVVPFPQSEPYWQTWVDPNRCRSADIEVPTTEVASNSSGLLFGERSWTFIGTKGRS
jgi:hypothetical protein